MSLKIENPHLQRTQRHLSNPSNLTTSENMRPSQNLSAPQPPDQAYPPRRISPCFRMKNPDGSFTYLRECAAPNGSEHPDQACLPRQVRHCSRLKNQDGSFTHLKVCEDSVKDEILRPHTRIPIIIPNVVENIIPALPSHDCPSSPDSLPNNHSNGGNGKGKSVPPAPPPPSLDSLYSPTLQEINEICIGEINLLPEIDVLKNRINSLEDDIARLVNITAWCVCSCHNSIPGRPVTPPPENAEQRAQSGPFPDPRNDWDESGEPGPSSPVAREQSVEGGEDFVGRVPLNLRAWNLDDIRLFRTLLERDVDLGEFVVGKPRRFGVLQHSFGDVERMD